MEVRQSAPSAKRRRGLSGSGTPPKSSFFSSDEVEKYRNFMDEVVKPTLEIWKHLLSEISKADGMSDDLRQLIANLKKKNSEISRFFHEDPKACLYVFGEKAQLSEEKLNELLRELDEALKLAIIEVERSIARTNLELDGMLEDFTILIDKQDQTLKRKFEDEKENLSIIADRKMQELKRKTEDETQLIAMGPAHCRTLVTEIEKLLFSHIPFRCRDRPRTLKVAIFHYKKLRMSWDGMLPGECSYFEDNTWCASLEDLQDFKSGIQRLFFQGQQLPEEDFEVFCRNTLWPLVIQKDFGNDVVHETITAEMIRRTVDLMFPEPSPLRNALLLANDALLQARQRIGQA